MESNKINDLSSFAKNLWEHNETAIEGILTKVNLISQPDKEQYEKMIERCLDEYEKVVINLIGSDKSMAERVIGAFKDEPGVEFLTEDCNDVHKKHCKAVFRALNSDDNTIVDYSKVTLTSQLNSIEHPMFIESGLSKEVALEKNEKRLCKMVAKCLKEGRSVRVHTYDKQTLNYLKGLLKGVGASSGKLEFVLDLELQEAELKTMGSELYSVIPMVNMQQHRQIYEYKKKVLNLIQS